MILRLDLNGKIEINVKDICIPFFSVLVEHPGHALVISPIRLNDSHSQLALCARSLSTGRFCRRNEMKLCGLNIHFLTAIVKKSKEI